MRNCQNNEFQLQSNVLDSNNDANNKMNNIPGCVACARKIQIESENISIEFTVRVLHLEFALTRYSWNYN